jgi:hypothetical protein
MQNHILSSAGDALRVSTQATCKLLNHYFSAIDIWNSFRVHQLMTEHLSTQERPDPRKGSLVSGVQTKVEPLLLVHLTHQQLLKTDY